ncbi:hypothetical protein ACSQ67_013680 [Phaseolus vulgaris]
MHSTPNTLFFPLPRVLRVLLLSCGLPACFLRQYLTFFLIRVLPHHLSSLSCIPVAIPVRCSSSLNTDLCYSRYIGCDTHWACDFKRRYSISAQGK